MTGCIALNLTNGWKTDKKKDKEGTKKVKKEKGKEATKKKKKDETNPETQWFYLTERNDEGDLCLLSRRVFVKDEVLGVYFGRKPEIKELSKYAIKTPHGVFDPI